MTVKVHSGVCMKYSRWDIYQVNERMPGCAPQCLLPTRTLSTHAHTHRRYSCQSAVVKRFSKAQLRLSRSSAIVHKFYYSLSFLVFDFLHPIGV